jgi:hypothetical protein
VVTMNTARSSSLRPTASSAPNPATRPRACGACGACGAP